MNRWLAWGASHRAGLAAVAAVYFGVNVASHDVVQAVALDLIDRLTIRGANLAVAVAGSIVALVALPWFVVRIVRGHLPWLKAFYVLATAALILASGRLLFAINSESIHFVQYGLLAWLVAPLVGRVGETIVLVTLLGAADEAFQYWVLHRNWGVYYDFNDVVLNLLGAAMGMLVLVVAADATTTRPAEYSMPRLLRSGAVRALALLGLACAGLVLTGRLTVDPLPDGTAWAVLRRSGPPGTFWVHPEWGRAYHVLSPLEGLLTSGVLMAFYVPLDFFARWIPAKAVGCRLGLSLAQRSPARAVAAEED